MTIETALAAIRQARQSIDDTMDGLDDLAKSAHARGYIKEARQSLSNADQSLRLALDQIEKARSE